MKSLVPRVEKIGKDAENMVQKSVGLIEFLGNLGLAFASAIRHPRQNRYGDFAYYLMLCGSQTLWIVLLLCYLMGLILGFQAAVQMRQYGAEIYVADMIGFSILKELGPLMVAMIITGRAGSAFAAEIGTMKVNEEISALRTMGISAEYFLVMPKLFALILAVPILTVFGDIAGIIGGLTVGITMLDLPFIAYYDRTVEVLSSTVMLLGLLKSLVFGILITITGCYYGFNADENAQGVGRAATAAVVSSIFMVVIADAILTVIFISWGQ